MSNRDVGTVYGAIINDVIETSKVDFEEGGVEEAVLDELRLGWQRKLTQLGVGTFEWDPKPQPGPVLTAAPVATASPAQAQAPGIGGYTQAQLSPPPNVQQLPLPTVLPAAPNGTVVPLPTPIKAEPGIAQNDPVIKQEPGLQNGAMPQGIPQANPSLAPGPNMRGSQVPLAAQRAAQALEGQFGQRAAASIHAIHSGMSQGPGQQAVRPGMPVGQGVNTQAYRPQIANAAALQQQQLRAQQAALAQGQNGLNKSQTDGPADEYDGVLTHCDMDGNQVELGRVEIDKMLHDQIAAKAKRMEGGGLMLPLKQAAKHSSGAAVKKKASTGLAQFDGPDDDGIKEEDFDNDAINSDLDDPDEDLEEEEDDDDAMGHIMLCMYDKVQRVKNKWKCTLKDGVLTVNGKDYVFHKATGEYEW